MLLDLLYGRLSIEIFVMGVIALVVAISVHEFSHALAARLQGDRTAEDMGRLTLNPLVHLDKFGTAMLLLVGFGYGKPVPFNPNNLKNHRIGPAIVGLAGPLSNIVLVVIFSILFKYLYPVLLDSPSYLRFLFILIQYNVVLFVFNLFPIPPLDGSKVLFALLPRSLHNIRLILEQYGPFILLGLIILPNGLFGSVFGFFLTSVIRIFGLPLTL
jgi:Zn-dependent protease